MTEPELVLERKPPVEIPVEITTLSRPDRIIRRLAEGTTPIPKLADEYGVSPQRVHSIAKGAVAKGELERIADWPATYRAGPALTAETGYMGHVESRQSASVRFHALQAKAGVVADSLPDADLSDWETWDTKHGKMARTEIHPVGGERLGLQIRGTGHPILVVGVPPKKVDIPYGERNDIDMGMYKAVETVKRHVAENVSVARTVCRDEYGVHTVGPPTWYRQPEMAIENFPGLSPGVRYHIWVDSSPGHTEAETDSLNGLRLLLRLGNNLSTAISTPLDDGHDGAG